MDRIRAVVSLVSGAVLLVAAIWMARLESSGPARVELTLDGGVPATLYLPWAAEDSTGSALVVESRSPAVVLAHGFASDRRGMSGLGRALTQAGYAVLSFDFRGHGENRNAFVRRGGRRDSLFADMRAAVDYLRTSPDVDGARISVMGHSMGAGVALEYASFDPALDATVLISGGRRVDGPQRPANALFIYGAGDPGRIRDRSAETAARLAEVPRAEPGKLYGSFRNSTAVSHIEVAKADHITILGSAYAARQIVDWLDESYGVERSTFFLRDDPRLRAAGVGLLAFVVLLPGLGALVGRLAPRLAERPAKGGLRRGLSLLAALLLTMPLVAIGGLERVVPLAIGDTVVLHFFASGVALLVWLVARDQLKWPGLRAALAASAGSATVAAVAVAFALAPFAVVLHGLGLTPERAAAGVLVAVLVLPFHLVFHDLLRRGGVVASTVACVLGRIGILAVLVLGVQTGALGGVVMLMLPVLALLFVLFEVLASAVYATSRNTLVPALVESAWLAWIFAAVLPITV